MYAKACPEPQAEPFDTTVSIVGEFKCKQYIVTKQAIVPFYQTLFESNKQTDY